MPDSTTESLRIRRAACALVVATVALLTAPPLQASEPLPDLSGLSFTAAFDSLCAHYSKYYAFSTWKRIDWLRLHDLYAPEVQQAEATADTSRFRMVMKRFASRFPDGHVRLRGNLKQLYREEIAGGFGFTLIQLSDATIAVNRVLPGTPASAGGITIGTIITHWGGVPVENALNDVDALWEGSPPATSEGARLAKLRRLVRAPVGEVVQVTYVNPGPITRTISLTAQDDSLRTWELSRYTIFDSDGYALLTQEQKREPVQFSILPSGIGYLKNRILVEFDENGNMTGGIDEITASLHEAIATFNAASVSGVIVDLRDNPGGVDRLAAVFASLFYDHTDVYEHVSFYDETVGHFAIMPQFSLYLAPQSSYFDGAVVCLVNAGTASSAEGVAMAIKRLPQGHVVGFYGTHGSFGLVGGESALPAAMGIQFTLGRSLDEDLEIQIDSDYTVAGGVTPDIHVPLTAEMVCRKFGEQVDVELEQAEAYLLSATPVHLRSFKAERRNNEAILQWEISAPHQTVQFHIWRQETGSAQRRISLKPITGLGPFRWVDAEAPEGETIYWLQEIGMDGLATWLGSASLPAIAASSHGLVLHLGRPSPFNFVTHIRFEIKEVARVKLAIYDARGRVVRLLRDETLAANSYMVEWDGRNNQGDLLSSGTYFCKLAAGGLQDVRKLTLWR